MLSGEVALQFTHGRFRSRVKLVFWPIHSLKDYRDRGWLSHYYRCLVRDDGVIDVKTMLFALLLIFIAVTKVFRDALLQRHPVILDSFLQKAVDAGESEVSAHEYWAFVQKLTATVRSGMHCPTVITTSMRCGSTCATSQLHHKASACHGREAMRRDIGAPAQSDENPTSFITNLG